VYDMNDIINFIIVNPWTNNLLELEKHLINHNNLNIFNRIEKNNIIHLVGRTSIGTTYEIILISSVLNNWMEWRYINNMLPTSRHMAELKNCIKLQKMIDNTFALR
jgi:hypothetical protein